MPEKPDKSFRPFGKTGRFFQCPDGPIVEIVDHSEIPSWFPDKDFMLLRDYRYWQYKCQHECEADPEAHLADELLIAKDDYTKDLIFVAMHNNPITYEFFGGRREFWDKLNELLFKARAFDLNEIPF